MACFVERCFPSLGLAFSAAVLLRFRVSALALTDRFGWKVFVMVGCPQGLVLDSKEYYAPVITPHEVNRASAPMAPLPSQPAGITG
jgi:diphthamide biosynthesis enzyme Dph1/Dph2-like protein